MGGTGQAFRDNGLGGWKKEERTGGDVILFIFSVPDVMVKTGVDPKKQRCHVKSQ